MCSKKEVISCFIESSEKTFWEENIISLAGIALAILTFIVERIISTRRAKREAKQTWFLSIIVEPQLDGIKKFYSETCNELNQVLEELNNASEELSHADYLVLKRTRLNVFKNRKASFFNSFVSMIKSYNHDLSKEVEAIVGTLDDLYSETLGKIGAEGADQLDMRDLTAKIYSNQTKLYAALFDSMNTEKKKNALQRRFCS